MATNGIQNGVLKERKDKRRAGVPDMKSGHSPKSDVTIAVMSLLAVGAVIIGALFRNTLIQTGHSLWSSSGDFISTEWGRFYDYFEGDYVKMGLVLYVFTVVEYWALGCLFLFMDLTGKPAFLTQYKVQPNETEIPPKKLRRLLLGVFLNQTLYSFPTLVGLYYLMRWRGCGLAPSELPTFPRFVMDAAVSYVIIDGGFYYAHWALHYPPLYKAIHKKHHEWTAPIGLVTVYCHPIENFFSNVFPVLAGPVLMRFHLMLVVVWLVAAQSVSMVHHSGYHLPFLPSPEYHDYHHLKFNQCYGLTGVFDWLHGTDTKFRQSKQARRHRLLTGFTPMNKIIPDDPKQKQ